jgi:chaperone modulatory protein CbpM
MPEPMHLPPVFVDEDIGLQDLTRSLRCNTELIVTLVHEGVLEPLGDSPDDWHFAGAALQRARSAVRLMRDLEINPPGVALALELIDEIRRLEAALALRVEDADASG